jgi:hypothetical protein
VTKDSYNSVPNISWNVFFPGLVGINNGHRIHEWLLDRACGKLLGKSDLVRSHLWGCHFGWTLILPGPVFFENELLFVVHHCGCHGNCSFIGDAGLCAISRSRKEDIRSMFNTIDRQAIVILT